MDTTRTTTTALDLSYEGRHADTSTAGRVVATMRDTFAEKGIPAPSVTYVGRHRADDTDVATDTLANLTERGAA